MNTITNEIPYKIDHIKEQEAYHFKIENVYDPSKFWVVLHIKERNAYENYLTQFYSVQKMSMAQYHLKKYSTCIVCRASKYYRAIILPSILPDMKKLRVFLIDYGQTVNVGIDDVYYIFKKHCSVPRFTIRACLAYISPKNQKEPWNSTDLLKFLELLSDREIYGTVEEIDKEQKILFLDLFGVKNNIQLSINSLMVQTGIGSYSKLVQNPNHKISKYKRMVKYMNLIPTFNALEKGIVPCSLWEKNLLKEIPLDLLYKQYYKYQDAKSHILDILKK